MAGKPHIDVQEWLGRVQVAEEYWADKLKVTEPLVKMYRTQARRDFAGDVDDMLPEVNKVWEFISNVLPQIFYQAPHAFVRPDKAGQQGNSEVAETVLNDAISRTKFTKHGRRTCVDALLRGWGVSKVAYIPSNLATYITPSGKEKVEKPAETVSPLGQHNEDDFQGRATFVNVPVENFIWDPDARDLEDARWCCHISLERYGELVANENYSNTDTIGHGDFRDSKAVISGAADEMESRDQQLVKIYELWIRDVVVLDDKDQPRRYMRKLLVLADGADKWLRWEDWPFARMSDFPFDMLTFVQDPEGEYPGLSDVAPWAGLAKCVNGFYYRANKFIKESGANYTYDSSLPVDLVEQIAKGDDGVMIPVETDSKFGDQKLPVENRVAPIQRATLPPEFWMLGGQMETNVHQISGHVPFGDVQAKLAGTATESNILAESASLRTEDRLSNGVAEWATSVFMKLFQVIAEWYDEPGSVPSLTPEEEKRFVAFTQEDLDFEARISIDFGTMGRITSDQQKKREFMMLTSLLSPYIMQGSVPYAMREWIRRGLKLYHIHDVHALLPDQRPPIEPGIENAALLACELVKVNPTDDDEYHLSQHAPFMERAGQLGYQGSIPFFQMHMQTHRQQMQMKAGRQEQQMPAGPGSITGNPDGDGFPGATPTSPDQEMGINVPGGM
jgi:hypothetical protein